MYAINEYQIVSISSEFYLYHGNKAAKISNSILVDILQKLKKQDKQKISDEELTRLATQSQINIEQLKQLLIYHLNIIKPLVFEQFNAIYIHTSDNYVVKPLYDTLSAQYEVYIINKDHFQYPSGSLVLFYCHNYADPKFQSVSVNLPDNVYLITAGIIHNLLIIDNIYFNGSGLPTHTSNIHQLIAYLNSDISATKDNWLLFYRIMAQKGMSSFINPTINPCQEGFVVYALYQFISQYTNLWKVPTTFDQMNWFWHVDLTSFNIHQEVAIHSPFSEFDMKLNLANIQHMESV